MPNQAVMSTSQHNKTRGR